MRKMNQKGSGSHEAQRMLVAMGYPKQLVDYLIDRYFIRYHRAQNLIWGGLFLFFAFLSVFHYLYDEGNPVPRYMFPVMVVLFLISSYYYFQGGKRHRVVERSIKLHPLDEEQKEELERLFRSIPKDNF